MSYSSLDELAKDALSIKFAPKDQKLLKYYVETIALCLITNELHDSLHTLKKEGCIIEKPTLWCLKVLLPEKIRKNAFGVEAISCSVAPDLNKHVLQFLMEGKKPNYFFYETSLFSLKKIVYNENLGYEISWLPGFETQEEVVNEIRRIIKILEFPHHLKDVF